MNTFVPILTASLLGAALSHGALVYVDATSGVSGNTVNATTQSGTDWVTGNTGTNADNLWSLRTTGPAVPAFGTTAYERNTVETPPVIRTTITGLLANTTYTGVRLYYMANVTSGSGNDWAIAATVQGTIAGGATPGTFTTFTDLSGTAVNTALSGVGVDQATPASGDYRRWVSLADATTDASGNLSVWIDIGVGASARGVYDGIAYDTVPVPEPSVALLGGLSLLGLLRRRRN